MTTRATNNSGAAERPPVGTRVSLSRQGRDGHEPGATALPAHVAEGPAPPRAVLLGAATLAVLVMAGAGVARRTGAGHVVIAGESVASTRDLWFTDRPGGDVEVRTRSRDGRDSLLTVLHTGQGMFIRGTLRALAHVRRGVAADPGDTRTLAATPFRLTRYADGRLTLDDPSTTAHVELGAFGATNAGAFAALLPNQ